MKVERASYDPDAKRIIITLIDGDTRIQMDIVGSRAPWFRRVFEAGLSVMIEAEDDCLSFIKDHSGTATDWSEADAPKAMHALPAEGTYSPKFVVAPEHRETYVVDDLANMDGLDDMVPNTLRDNLRRA